MKQRAELDPGIKGWLGVFTLGAILTPFSIILGQVTGFSSMKNLWNLGYKQIVMIEILGNLALVVLSGYGIWLILKLKARVKRFYIYLLLFDFVFLLIDSGFTRNIIQDLVNRGTIDSSTGVSLSANSGSGAARAFLVAIIWIPYLLKSKRVKMTMRRPIDSDFI